MIDKEHEEFMLNIGKRLRESYINPPDKPKIMSDYGPPKTRKELTQEVLDLERRVQYMEYVVEKVQKFEKRIQTMEKHLTKG